MNPSPHEANAALIVAAVNQHAALVEALKVMTGAVDDLAAAAHGDDWADFNSVLWRRYTNALDVLKAAGCE